MMQQQKKQRQRRRQQPEPFEPYHTDTDRHTDRQTEVYTLQVDTRQVFHGPFQKKKDAKCNRVPLLCRGTQYCRLRGNAFKKKIQKDEKYPHTHAHIHIEIWIEKCKGKHAADSGVRVKEREGEVAGSSERVSCRRFNDFLAALFGLLSSLWATFLGADLSPPTSATAPLLHPRLTLW